MDEPAPLAEKSRGRTEENLWIGKTRPDFNVIYVGRESSRNLQKRRL
ncbi:MAG: hypothetical protein QME57_04530 [Patescibacteria group bacterium]|nr:hypothetical protein [Patescibacteria group bacterium]